MLKQDFMKMLEIFKKLSILEQSMNQKLESIEVESLVLDFYRFRGYNSWEQHGQKKVIQRHQQQMLI